MEIYFNEISRFRWADYWEYIKIINQTKRNGILRGLFFPVACVKGILRLQIAQIAEKYVKKKEEGIKVILQDGKMTVVKMKSGDQEILPYQNIQIMELGTVIIVSGIPMAIKKGSKGEEILRKTVIWGKENGFRDYS